MVADRSVTVLTLPIAPTGTCGMREPEHPEVACTLAASVVIQIEAVAPQPYKASKSTIRVPICEQHRQALPDLLSAWAGRVLEIQEG